MVRLITLILLMLFCVCVKAQNNIESFNIISDENVESINDVQIIRPINGGTVIIPSFENTCTEEMKAPFAYACKIVEEYMPPCLPLRINVKCGRVNSSAGVAISKVVTRSKENFGDNMSYRNAPMSMIKGVVLAELTCGESKTYLDSIPNVGFFTEDADIEITYNQQKLSELSYSIDLPDDNKYDFVSLAVRDILIGLGISSSYRSNPATGGLNDPTQMMTPFECMIDAMLGNRSNPTARMAAATQGKLVLKTNTKESVQLYAPSKWKNGVSLNYFIPQEDCDITNILSYSFGKGTVSRSLADDYAEWFFSELLGWIPNYVVGNVAVPSVDGSTSFLMPYNGTLSIPSISNQRQYESRSDSAVKRRDISGINQEVYDYVMQFHPFQTAGTDRPTGGTSVSFLKKDGTWDLVSFMYSCPPSLSLAMSDLEFHCNNEDYARTIDGYLRARITVAQTNIYGATKYSTTYFVADYLPQKITLSYSTSLPLAEKVYTDALTTAETVNVRIYFQDFEGVDRVVLERLRQGNRLPSKIDVPNFKCGYFDTTVDKYTTFTAVGYNDNGSSRSVPLVINPLKFITLPIYYTHGTILIGENGAIEEPLRYSISALNDYDCCTLQSGVTNGRIETGSLPRGLYLLSVYYVNGDRAMTFRFRKD